MPNTEEKPDPGSRVEVGCGVVSITTTSNFSFTLLLIASTLPIAPRAQVFDFLYGTYNINHSTLGFY